MDVLTSLLIDSKKGAYFCQHSHVFLYTNMENGTSSFINLTRHTGLLGSAGERRLSRDKQ